MLLNCCSSSVCGAETRISVSLSVVLNNTDTLSGAFLFFFSQSIRVCHCPRSWNVSVHLSESICAHLDIHEFHSFPSSWCWTRCDSLSMVLKQGSVCLSPWCWTTSQGIFTDPAETRVYSRVMRIGSCVSLSVVLKTSPPIDLCPTGQVAAFAAGVVYSVQNYTVCRFLLC